jgi:hypothetical protein
MSRKSASQCCSFKNIFLLCALLITLALSPQVFGQAVTATLVGQVSDLTGDVVPTAKVTITNQQTGTATSVMTNESGNYEFPFVTPGVYTVSVTHEGFKASVTKNVNVAVNTTVRVEAKLTVGSVVESITVSSETPVLETDRADVNGQITSQQVADMPVGNNRNFQALETLIPGVAPSSYDHSSFFDAQNAQNFSVNGQSELTNNLQLEGIDDNERSGELQGVYIPPAAAIQTVDVETNNYAPEFGRANGAITNVVLKSGTNQFHGSVYEFNSVAATSARSYFNNTGVLPGFTNNYFGGTIGGPIRKNRTFFFADVLRYSNHNSNYNLLTIPTAAFRTGDLSASPTAIYDPNTGNSNGTGRQQFITNGTPNVIPAARINPISTKLIALLPLPNIPGAGFTNNYQETLGYSVDTNQFDGKLDQNIGKNDHLVIRYSFENNKTFQQPAFGLAGGPGGSTAGFQGTGINTVYSTAGEYTHVFSDNLVTEARLGVDHYYNTAQQSDYGSTASTDLGIPGINDSAFNSGITTIQIADYSTPLIGYNNGLPWQRGETNIDAVNNWTKIIKNHTFKFGWELRRVRDDLLQGQNPNPRGVYQYESGETALNAPTPPASGFANAWAAFLLDVPYTAGIDAIVNDLSFRQTLYFGFVQDTFQASSKLTFTYGLRWELYQPLAPKRKGGYSQYDPSTNSLLVAGYGNVPLNLGMPWNNKDFAPRMGFAFRPTHTTVLRGGFGASYDPWQGVGYANNYPVNSNTSFASLNSFSTALNQSGQPVTLSQGFPLSVAPVIPSTGIITNAPTSSAYSTMNTKYKDPYAMSYSLTIEQVLSGGWTASIAYVGNQGRQVPGHPDLNAGLVLGAGAAGQPEYATFGRTASNSLLLQGTNSNYNSLQARLNHHFSKGFLWTSAYTWQKAMGFTSNSVSGPGAFNFNIDFSRNYSVLNYTAPQTYSQSVVYDLPFGHNKSFLSNSNSLVSSIVSGWKVSDVLIMSTGLPLNFTASTSGINAPSNIQVPNEISPFKKLKGIGTSHPWFDTSSFTQPVGAVFGNMGQEVYKGPGQITMNTSMFRSFPIHDSVSLELRMDALNSLNHPTFAAPNTSLTSSSFGQVTAITGAARTLQFAGTLSF